MNTLAAADALLAGTYAKRDEVTVILPTLNFTTYEMNNGHFGADVDFPLAVKIADNPVTFVMNANYTITALNSIPLDLAVDTTNLTWLAGDNAPWLGENNPASHDGTDDAGSGPIGDGQSSTMQTTVGGAGVPNVLVEGFLTGVGRFPEFPSGRNNPNVDLGRSCLAAEDLQHRRRFAHAALALPEERQRHSRERPRLGRPSRRGSPRPLLCN